MSIKVTSWVWSHSQAQGIDRLVLLAIADHCDADGRNAWPRIATLVWKTGLSKATVRRSLVRLVALGELEVERQAGGNGETRADHRPNLYRVFTSGPRPAGVGGRDEATRLQDDTPSRSQRETPSASPRGLTVDVTGSHPRGVVNETPIYKPSEGPITVLEPSVKPPVPTVRRPSRSSGSATTAKTQRALLAKAIVSAWWDARKASGDPPAQKFIAVVKVVEGVLANGVTESDVAWALANVPTVSAGAIEMALSRRRQRGCRPSTTSTAMRMVAEAQAAERQAVQRHDHKSSSDGRQS